MSGAHLFNFLIYDIFCPYNVLEALKFSAAAMEPNNAFIERSISDSHNAQCLYE